MVADAAAGLGQDVNTQTTSYDTLVFDDVQQSRAHKVVLGNLKLGLENCEAWEML